MPFQPVPRVAHVALNGTLHNEQVQNNLHFLTPDPAWSVAALTSLADLMAAWWVEHVRPNLASAYVLRNVVATDLTTEIAPQHTSTTGLPAAGTLPGEALPGNVCLCLSFRTGFTGRSARGRNYIGGLSEGSVTGNTVGAGIVNNLAGAYAELLGGSIGGFTWVVVQRVSGGEELEEGIARPITSVVVVDTNVDSQRRRLAGRGA